MKSVIVQKYGGKCLATPENILGVAHQVQKRRQQGHSVITVVSAMGQTTDELIELAYKVSSTPHPREMDMLLTTGERVSMALLSMALHDLGCPSVSFTGSQAGVFTDSSHSNARITDIRPHRIEEALKNNKAVVLAGFQGVNPDLKEVTTLGRGGSDTTAVAIAAHFKAHRCEILKDVDGVYSADPKVVPQAQRYTQLSFKHLTEMCFWGAKVLHYRSVELAQKMSVPLFVGSATNPSLGTLITEEVQDMYEKESVLSVNSHKEIFHIRVNGKDMAEATQAFHNFLNKNQLAWPQWLASAADKDHCRFMITAPTESLKALQKAATAKGEIEVLPKILSSVTVTCFGSMASDFPAKVLSLLAKENIVPEKVLNNPMSVSVFIKPEQREKAIQMLHELTA